MSGSFETSWKRGAMFLCRFSINTYGTRMFFGTENHAAARSGSCKGAVVPLNSVKAYWVAEAEIYAF